MTKMKNVKYKNNEVKTVINTEKILEFDKIKEKLSQLAYTKNAKKQIEQLRPYMSETEVCSKQRETTEAKTMIEKCGNPPITALQGIDEWIELAHKGGCLTIEQLENIGSALTAVRRLKDYLNQCKQFGIGLAYFEENLDSLDDVREQLNEKIRNGRVDDYASKLLKTLRESFERTDKKMREKADAVMKSNKEYMSDNFSTTRNGHLCVPVKKEYKFKISGSVIDKSSSGSTLFIEPAAVAKLHGELEEIKIDEENEEKRILYMLSDMLADKAEIIFLNNQTIEKLDFAFAKAKLSIEYDGIQPNINTERYIRLKNGRHPLMEKSKNVPLNFQIGKELKGIIITGPNTGGKTVAIKTVALNCMMAQSGLHAASEEADICMNNAVLCDIGDGQNLSENLSTFSSHIKNVLDILENVSHESLVVLDELGSGTDPAEGMGIAIAILEELKKSGALFLATTHYPEIKTFAEQAEGIVNARMTFDKESLKPLYQLVIGEAGESCAFYIAGRLGMPAEMLSRAALAAYGEMEDTFHKKEFEQFNKEEKGFNHKPPKIQNKKKTVKQKEAIQYHLGDSVMVLPDQKIGIVCETANEKGILRVQLQNKKIWISHKRIRLQVAAEQLYPKDYDFSIIFDSVEKRKAQHKMKRKHIEEALEYEE